LIEEQIAYVRAHLDGAEVVRQPDGICAIRWPFNLPSPWSPTLATLVLLLPPQFPAQAPSGFDIVGTASRAGASAGGTGLRQVGNEQWTHFCWNPNGAIDYTGDDAIWRCAKFAESRFLVQQ
jgi:hypothetical protein